MATLAACDSNGVLLRHRSNGSGQLVNVTVVDIAPGCAGGRLRLVALNATGSVIGSASASLPGAGFSGQASLGISPAVAATAVAKVVVAIDER
ncbi:MAG TPA: hypothetical protein VM305_03155 [Candidatus Limnocylindrales bacterium]|nr:hypothetical protein [Candidatus Limnocylindrales bacterium]